VSNLADSSGGGSSFWGKLVDFLQRRATREPVEKGWSVFHTWFWDPLKVGDLAAAGPFRRFPALHIAVELLPRGAAACEKLVLEESFVCAARCWSQ
jgi:hypothetical protein